MRQRGKSGLVERGRSARRLVEDWRRRDPQTWIIVLVGMAMGLCLFLIQLAMVGALRFVAYVAKSLR